mmetsp:Transcript_64158/g.202812  ORF Transcript_64158/g.202812 Transcript_64158/m.202812 type:complete len:293 (-) Transcript_64158:634-1512(-)
MGSLCALLSPSFAKRSKCGPPGTCVMPKMRAVLSNASPMESSMVLPRIVWCPTPRDRTAMLWPPDTSSVRNGNCGNGCGTAMLPASLSPASAAGALGNRVTNMCASMWWTRTSGNRCFEAICSALRTPTSKQRPKPGPTVTATAVRSATSTPALRKASSTVALIASRCPSWANRGTTPPHFSWMWACEASASPRIWPLPKRTAAPVSSQLDSMPNTRHSRESAGNGRQFRLPEEAERTDALSVSVADPLTATAGGALTSGKGSLGADRSGPPSACHRSRTACHLCPTAEKTT